VASEAQASGADINSGTLKGSPNPPAKSSAGHSHADAGSGERGKIKRRELIGIITSDKMQKTRVVMVERRLSHAKYGKYMTSRTKYKAHDEKNEYKTGDRVLIVEARPLSRDKRWRVEKLIERPQEA
jgi:small subunit ribosomal protein S17